MTELTIDQSSGQNELDQKEAEFALPDTRMFIKTIIQRVAKEKEVCIVTVSGTEHRGFITGLDREWLQLTTTKDQQLVLVNLLNMESLEETGKNLNSVEISKEEKSRIRVYSSTVFVKAREITRTLRAERSRFRSRNSELDSEELDLEDEFSDEG